MHKILLIPRASHRTVVLNRREPYWGYDTQNIFEIIRQRLNHENPVMIFTSFKSLTG